MEIYEVQSIKYTYIEANSKEEAQKKWEQNEILDTSEILKNISKK